MSGSRWGCRLLVGVALLCSTAAWCQSYPSQALRLVVPFAPGGATDILARTIGARLAERLGQPVVVENKPGAGTTIGNAAVAVAAADGYTLLFAPTPFVISQVMYPKLPYDPDKAFTPVTLLAISPFILVAHPGVDAKTVPELLALAKARSGVFTFASAGNGTVPHLAGQSATVLLRPGEEFGAFIAAEKVKWSAVVKASGARID